MNINHFAIEEMVKLKREEMNIKEKFVETYNLYPVDPSKKYFFSYKQFKFWI
ncbi:hypothetical protein [Peribacillus alkalitolerans]|uniref:hypothetical protein n=1 Tax=Peribacillus alkalitolerans TaxID=1550385 RepID=UPI0013CFA497|nr:hypothetical protein [Peribacillus alkalitolerans]